MEDTVITHSAEETEKFGEEFGRKLKLGDVICFYGNLGAGKTTFTKGIAKGLGIISRIISPTFTLVRQHEFRHNEKVGILYHIDLYRLENQHQIEEIGFQEIVTNPLAITLIEWPERLEKLPEKRIDIRLKEIGEAKREVTIMRV